jgi:CBS domain-containing protein
MENQIPDENDHTHKSEFRRFAAKRIIFFTLVGIVAIWGIGVVIGYFEKSAEIQTAQKYEDQLAQESPQHIPQPEALKEGGETEPSHEITPEQGHEATTGPSRSDKNTAGSIMTMDFVALDKDLTASEAVEYLRKTHRGKMQPDQSFVVDENQTLVGVVTRNQLLFASSEAVLKDFMSTDTHSVRTGIEAGRIKSLIDRHGLPSIPVVDDTDKLVGVIKADQVMGLAMGKAEKAPESVQAPTHEMAGPAHEAQAPAHETPAPSTKAQTPTHAPAAPTHETAEKKTEHPEVAVHGKTMAEAQKETAHKAPQSEETKPKAVGVAFVEAAIEPLNYELNERFYGWRPNDILNFTDNVNNYQLGVLEVTRRTVVALTERISRTGATAAFDENLENGMNWLMIKARKYWFPSPEDKYNASLHELRIYKEKLEKGEAKFHTRTDNLIPLLMDFEDLLGSCEENLVKTKEDDGSSVSFFKADDYFFYAKGVASAMGTILEGVLIDFRSIIDSRRGVDTIHHAIESCREASEISPWIVTNSSLGGILANHRANMAAPLSHARFYIGVLIKTLST